MICNNCGRQSIREDANFCEYCGNSFREQAPYNPILPKQEAAALPDKEKPVSFLNWLGSYALIFIPFVGGLVFIVMLFVWAFGGYVPTSKKNWARAMLIMVAVATVFVIIFLIVAFNNMNILDIFNGNFNLERFLDEYKYAY